MLLEASKVVKDKNSDAPPPGEEEQQILAEQLTTYDLSAQTKYASKNISLGAVDELDETLCMTLRSASLIDKETTAAWLLSHISRVNEIINVDEKNKMDEVQQTLLASSILNYMDGLNLIEVCIFFARLREGRYGKFYNRFDNTQFEQWKQSFFTELNREIAEFQDAMKPIRMKEEEEKRRAGRTEEELRIISGKEYNEMKRQEGQEVLSIEERILRHRKFHSSKKRTGKLPSGIPLTQDGKIDMSREAYMRTLEEVRAPPPTPPLIVRLSDALEERNGGE